MAAIFQETLKNMADSIVLYVFILKESSLVFDMKEFQNRGDFPDPNKLLF